MNVRHFTIPIRRLFRRSRLLQIGLIFAFWLAGEVIIRITGLPLPGPILGLALALAALALGGIGIMSLKRGADWFLADMLLFFVPAVLAVLDHREFFGLLGAKLFVIIVVSTAAVMGVTALTVDLFYRWGIRHARSTHIR